MELKPYLLFPKSPSIILLQASYKSTSYFFSEFGHKRTPNISFRFLRGHKMQTKIHLIDEFAAAFQFPLWLSEDWDSFNNCLYYLDSIPKSTYIFLIYNAQELLIEEPKGDFQIFLEILDNVGKSWHEGVAKEPEDVEDATPQIPFHVVLQCLPEDFPNFQARLKATKVEFVECEFLQEPIEEE